MSVRLSAFQVALVEHCIDPLVQGRYGCRHRDPKFVQVSGRDGHVVSIGHGGVSHDLDAVEALAVDGHDACASSGRQDLRQLERRQSVVCLIFQGRNVQYRVHLWCKKVYKLPSSPG